MDNAFLENLRDKISPKGDVPEGYFAKFPDRLMARIREEEALMPKVAAPVRQPWQHQLGRWLAILVQPRWAVGLASMTLVLGTLFWVFAHKYGNTTTTTSALAELDKTEPQELMVYIDEHFDQFADDDELAMMADTNDPEPPKEALETPQAPAAPVPNVAELKKIDVFAELDKLDAADVAAWFDNNPSEIDAALDDE